MIQNLSATAERFLLDLTRIQKSIAASSGQITSGLKVQQPSDAPDQIGEILQLRSSIQKNDQILTNLGRVQSENQTASSTLETATRIVERARVLASQAASSNQTADSRAIIATEVQSLLEELVSASNTMAEGRYVFSGDQDGSASYAVDLSDPEGVTQLVETTATRRVEHPSGTTFTASRTAAEIFDLRNTDGTAADANVFAAVNGLRVALAANDQTGIDTALSNLRAAGDHLNESLSFYGSVENKISEAIDYGNRYAVQLKTELSGREDADVVTAILELESAKTSQEAAYAARAQMPTGSLFDYLR
jgi:flagellar hook-associated protein 3 FlgL